VLVEPLDQVGVSRGFGLGELAVAVVVEFVEALVSEGDAG